ncbi:MAG: PAS domain S-box protein [Marinilabiliaceae bacterium]
MEEDKRVEGVESSTLFNSLPIGVVYYDAGGEVLSANSAANEILGYTTSPGQLCYDHLEKILSGDGSDISPDNHPCIVALRTGEPVYDVVMGVFHPLEKKYRWINVNAVPEFRDGETQPFRAYITLQDVTETISIRQRLKNSEARYRTLVDNMYSGLVIIQDGMIRLVNDALVCKSGYTRDELEGTMFLKYVESKEQPRVEQMHLKRLTGDEAPDNYRTRVVAKDGTSAWFDIRVKTIEYDSKPAVLALLNDVDTQVKFEQRLQRSELRFRILFENAPIGIALLRGDGRLLLANEKLAGITGFSLKELKTMSFVDVSHPDDVKKDQDLFKQLIEGDIDSYDLMKRYLRKNGEVVWGELKVRTVFDDEGRKLAIGMVEDRTEEKNAQEELVLTRDLARDSSRLKSAFLASISHELRTPLNAVLGFSDIIQSMSEDENIREYSGLIYENGFKLMTIIDDILDLAMSDHGKIRLRPDTFRTVQLFDEFRNQLHEILYRSGKDNIDIRAEVDENLRNTEIVTDKSKVYQVLVNLIKNAVKFTDEGFIKIGCFNKDADHISFYIQDTGMGIPVDQQEVIFEFFRQGDDAINRQYGGIGIGLAISKRVAKAMNGDLTLESEPGKGSVFTFTLPKILEEGDDAVK